MAHPVGADGRSNGEKELPQGLPASMSLYVVAEMNHS